MKQKKLIIKFLSILFVFFAFISNTKADTCKVQIVGYKNGSSDLAYFEKNSKNKIHVETKNGTGCTKDDEIVWTITNPSNFTAINITSGSDDYSKGDTIVTAAGTSVNLYTHGTKDITLSNNATVTACLKSDPSNCDSVIIFTKTVSGCVNDMYFKEIDGKSCYVCCPSNMYFPTNARDKCIKNSSSADTGSQSEKTTYSETENTISKECATIKTTVNSNGSKKIEVTGDTEKETSEQVGTIDSKGNTIYNNDEYNEYSTSGTGHSVTVAGSSGLNESEEFTEYDYSAINACEIKHVIDACKIVARILVIIKILTPVILVIISFKSLADAIVDENETDLKKYTRIFIQRFILAVCIFFLPTFLNFIMGLLIQDGYTNVVNTYGDCITCVLDINSCPENSELYVLKTDGSSDAYVNYDYSDEAAKCTGSNENVDLEDSSLLGDPTNEQDLAYYVQFAFDIMKYLGVILCIVFSAVDIIKAIMAGDKDMYKPVVSKTIKRLCYVAILLFLPQIIEVLMTITGIYNNCGIS